MPDDDLETRLRRTFAERADQAPPPGPVQQRTLSAVRPDRRRRAGWFRSVAFRPVGVAAAVLIVVGATVGGVTLVRDLDHGTGTGTHHVTASSRPATATASATSSATSGATPGATSGVTSGATVSAPPPAPGTGSTSVPSTSTSTRPTTGPVPDGFAVTDLSFVSTDTGWALGTTPSCARAPCTSLLRTVDGGRHWVGLAPPRADLATVRGCTSSDCVSGVRFANAHVGYLFGPETLWLTRDGGASWTRLAGGAEALEIAAGNVLRVTGSSPSCPPGCAYVVQLAAVAGSDWHTVLTTAGTQRTSAELVRAGDNAFVQVEQTDSDGTAITADPAFYSSTDGGRHWQSRGEACPQPSGASVTYDSSALTPSPSGSVTVLCRPRTSGPAPFVATSTDAGRTFVAGAPNAGLSAPLGAASARVLFATDQSHGQTSGQLLRSGDGGRTWSTVATAPAGSAFGGYVSAFLGFENVKTGRWVSSFNPALVWTTRDSGKSWTRDTFR